MTGKDGTMTRLHDLYRKEGQSPWLDNLRRDWLTGGRLAEMVDQGVRGITSNPTIFAKAISGEDDYDEQFRSLVPGHTVEEAYWELVISDIEGALEVLRPAPRGERRGRRLRLLGGGTFAGPRHRGRRWPRPGACTSGSIGPTCW